MRAMEIDKKNKIIISVLILLMASCSGKLKFSELLEKMDDVSRERRSKIFNEFINQQAEFPLIEDSIVYFLFKDSLHQSAYLAGDMNSWKADSLPMQRLEGTAYFFIAQKFPRDARLEYKFVVDSQYVLDPLNKKRERGGHGYNSVFFMHGYRFPKETLLDRAKEISLVDTFSYAAAKKDTARKIFYYHHAQATAASPLIIFNDGQEYLELGAAAIVLDNLTGAKRIPPVNALFVNPLKRRKEYWLNDKYLSMVFSDLLPRVRSMYGLSPQAIGMGGVSLGGVISLYALKDYSYQLDFVFLQSGALQIDNEMILRVLTNVPAVKTKVYYDYGTFEGMDAVHGRLTELLQQKNMIFSHNTYNEGHNWGNWRAHLAAALEYCLKSR